MSNEERNTTMEYLLTPAEKAHCKKLFDAIAQADAEVNQLKSQLGGAMRLLASAHGLDLPATLTDDCGRLVTNGVAGTSPVIH
jgi:hypothetical protein